MLKIRNNQMYVLKQTTDSEIIDLITNDLRELYPDLLQEHGEDGFKTIVQRSFTHGRTEYELDSAGDLRKFVELSLLFGEDFDQDPLLPWAGPVLRTSTLSPSDRMALVWFDAERFLASDDDNEDSAQDTTESNLSHNSEGNLTSKN